jgi:hypothetical protein
VFAWSCAPLPNRAELKAGEGDGGTVTLIQHFGSAANLNIHLHRLVLDSVYAAGGDGVPTFVDVTAPTDAEQQRCTRCCKRSSPG